MSLPEAGKSVSDYLGNGERIVYVNVMNRLSIDCDCDGSPSEPDLHDIGILASTDPVYRRGVVSFIPTLWCNLL